MELIPQKIIGRRTDPYMIRWSILETPWFGIKIHKFLKSDNDCLHDHPWDFVSIILKGGYWKNTGAEYGNGTFVGGRWHKPGKILYRPAEWKHSVQLQSEYFDEFGYNFKRLIPAITLVITFRKRRTWGFWSNNKFIHWKKFNPNEHKC